LDLSGLEFGSLAGKLDSTLGGYYVNNIYLTGSATVILKLHMSDRPEVSLLLSPRLGAWITSAELPRAPVDRFVSHLRERLTRAKFAAARAPEGERMLVLEFSHPDGGLSLVGEFFGAGNIILLDASSVVISCLYTLEVRGRTVRPGIKYEPPISRSLPLSRVDRAELRRILSSDDPVERLLGRGIAIPRRIVEETLRRSGIPKGKAGSSLTDSDAEFLLEAFRAIIAEASKGSEAYVYLSEGKPVEISSVRIQLGDAVIEKPYPSILAAMDGLFTPGVVQGLASESVKTESDDLRMLEASIGSKRKELEALRMRASGLKAIASALMAGSKDYEAAAADLKAVSSYRFERGSGSWSVDGRRIRVDSPFALASQIFSDAKEVEASSDKLEEAMLRLDRRREELASSIDEEREAKVVTKQRRERKWFEKFRWFYTSEGYFAIGGRDAGSNSILVRKHLEPTDLVFHTEIAGSSFFILKGGQGAGEQSIREVAEATVSYSRAWREGLTAADAYYVKPGQVLRGAPSGQYLPKGSFVIEGERNYLKGIELRVSLGVGALEGELMLFSGPASALIQRCVLVIELVPGHFPTSEAGKKVKREFAAHLEGPPKAFVEGLHVDEFIRALPTGKLRQLRILKGREPEPDASQP
jgi:predicted ribosome quality control (RQC) complex YloA/Tae2 family protein